MNIPNHPYVLLDRNVLCNCDIEAESNFLLESLTACDEHKNPVLEMYFTVNLAFLDYLTQLNVTLNKPTDRNWTSVKQSIPVSLDSFQINPKLMNAPSQNSIKKIEWQLPNMNTQSLNSESS